MKKLILLFILFFSSLSHAWPHTENASLIKKGENLLHEAIQHNQRAIRGKHYEKLRFVIPLDDPRYSTQQEVGKHGGFINPALLDKLESSLQESYKQYGIECYLLLINAFDVVIKAKIPEGSTVEDLFGNGSFFNEQSNILRMQAEHDTITASIIRGSILENKRPAYILSLGCYKAQYYKGNGVDYYFYNFRHTTTSGNVAYFNEVYNYVKVSLKNNPDFRFQENRDSLASIPVTTLERAHINIRMKGQILHSYTPESITSILESFTNKADYYTLCVAERLHILSLFVSEKMSGSYTSPGEEGYALQVIIYTPKEDVKALLAGLENPSVLNGNTSYSGDKQNTKALIKRLIDEIDDAIVFGLGGNNYQKLITKLGELILSSPEAAKHYSEADENSIMDRMIYWGNEGSPALIGSHKYDFAIQDDGKIKCKKTIVDRWDYEVESKGGFRNPKEHWDNSSPEYKLRPFDLVVFVNKTGCSMVEEAGAEKDAPKILPAIFLQYAKDKLNEETTFKAISLTVDALTVATGPGLFYKAAKAGRYAVAAFEAAGFVGSVGNISLNVMDDPELAEVVDSYNKIMAGWGLTRGLLALKSFSPAFIQSAVNQELKQIPKQTAENFMTAFTKAKDKLSKLPAESKAQIEKLEKYFEGKGVKGSIVKGADDLTNAFINGWTKEKILALPKGQRPKPADYLKQSYIGEHLEKFNNGIVRFTSKTSFKKYNTLGPDGGFIISKEGFDRILTDTKGDLRKIEQKLGFDEGYLSEDDIMIVFIDKQNLNEIKMPSGNESGTNSFWIPGGYTSGNIPEAVMNFSDKPVFSEIILKK